VGRGRIQQRVGIGAVAMLSVLGLGRVHGLEPPLAVGSSTALYAHEQRAGTEERIWLPSVVWKPGVSGRVTLAGGHGLVVGPERTPLAVTMTLGAETVSGAAVTGMRMMHHWGELCWPARQMRQGWFTGRAIWRNYTETAEVIVNPQNINGLSVYVQFRSGAGEVSALVCDDVWVEGVYLTPTPGTTPEP